MGARYMIFTPDDIQARLRKKPLPPLRIVTTTRENYDIYHPDMVLVARHFIMVGVPSKKNPALADSVTRVALVPHY
jgi:hypothetical protein